LSVNRARTARRIVLDRWASRVVVVGGIIVIACILAILFVIALEVYPLFRPASATLAGTYGAAVGDDSGRPAPGSALGVDEHREIAFVVTRGGALDFISLTGGANPPAVPIAGLEGARVASVAALGKGRYAIGTSDGRVIPLDMAFDVAFADGQRRIRPQPVFGAPSAVDPEARRPISRLATAAPESGAVTVAQVGPEDLVVQSTVDAGAHPDEPDAVAARRPPAADATDAVFLTSAILRRPSSRITRIPRPPSPRWAAPRRPIARARHGAARSRTVPRALRAGAQRQRAQRRTRGQAAGTGESSSSIAAMRGVRPYPGPAS
jgi:hypothetical protein